MRPHRSRRGRDLLRFWPLGVIVVGALAWQAPRVGAAPSATPAPGLRYAPTPAPSGSPSPSPGPTALPGTSLAPPASTLARAATLQAAVATASWAEASRELAGLDAALTDWLAQAPRTGPLRQELYHLRASLPGLEAAIGGRRKRAANDAAYSLVLGVLSAEALQAARAGGGGGRVSAPSATARALDHLERAYGSAVQAHLALLAARPAQARPHLDATREALKEARRAGPEPRLAARLESLDRQRWRVVAALDEPTRGRSESRALVQGCAETFRAVGTPEAVPQQRKRAGARR